MQASAGILVYRFKNDKLEVLLGHMGGPFWKNKDERAWTIIKGESDKEEDPFQAAIREFVEETGFKPGGDFIELDQIKQSANKVVKCWALEQDLDPDKIESNYFELEWPPNSGQIQKFTEIDRAEWFELKIAYQKIIKGQTELLDQLSSRLDYNKR